MTDWADDIMQEMISRLEEGESMRSICKDKRLPDRRTIERWARGDDELAANIVRARELGYHARAEKAVEDAKSATDASLGRLAFDAERWHLSKLTRAFADKVTHEHGGEGGGAIPVNLTVSFVKSSASQAS